MCEKKSSDAGTSDNKSEYMLASEREYYESKIGKFEDLPSKFPVEVLPLELQEYINSAKENMGMKPEFLAAAMLAATATAIGATRRIKINTGWYYKPIIYMCLIGRPSSGKTSAVRRAFAPLNQLNIEMAKRSLEAMKKDEKPGINQNPQSSIVKQIIYNNTTLEALLESMSANPHGACYSPDELTLLINSFNQYKGTGSDEQNILMLFDGHPFEINRKSIGAKVVLLEDPFLVIISTCQNGIFESVFNKPRQDNGFLYRLLLVPEESPDDDDFHIKPFPEKYDEWWNDLLHKIVDDCDTFFKGFGGPDVFQFDALAFEQYENWNRKWKLASRRGDERVEDVFGRISAYAAKFALILYTLDEFLNCDAPGEKTTEKSAISAKSSDNMIDLRYIVRGTRIAEYFFHNTIEFLNMADQSLPKAKYRQKCLLKKLPSIFTTNKLHEMAEEFGVDYRTIRRDVDALIKEGIIVCHHDKEIDLEQNCRVYYSLPSK